MLVGVNLNLSNHFRNKFLETVVSVIELLRLKAQMPASHRPLNDHSVRQAAVVLRPALADETGSSTR